MSTKQLHTQFVYTIRNTKSESVYRSKRNPRFVIKVRTLSQM
jgi:hypothetical protein